MSAKIRNLTIAIPRPFASTPSDPLSVAASPDMATPSKATRDVAADAVIPAAANTIVMGGANVL